MGGFAATKWTLQRQKNFLYSQVLSKLVKQKTQNKSFLFCCCCCCCCCCFEIFVVAKTNSSFVADKLILLLSIVTEFDVRSLGHCGSVHILVHTRNHYSQPSWPTTLNKRWTILTELGHSGSQDQKWAEEHGRKNNKLDYSHRQRLAMFLKKKENAVLFCVLFKTFKNKTKNTH